MSAAPVLAPSAPDASTHGASVPETPTLQVADPEVALTLRAEREANGLDRWDEVWNGVYIIMPLPNNEHQELAFEWGADLRPFIKPLGARTFVGCNVTDIEDRTIDWRLNYRCPDVAVYLPGNPAEDRGSHWFGGPDLAVEVVSPGDRSRQKLGFYANVGVRELYVLDRDPWALELYRLTGGELRSVGTARPGGGPLRSETLPVAFSLTIGDPPAVAVAAVA